MDMYYNNGDLQIDGMSPATEDESGLMLASAYPKKRAGRKKFKETRHPVYRGVRQKSSGKWVCEVREPNKKSRIWLGTYPTLEMAARAHDVAAIALRGRSGACLNFADSAWRLPVPSSTNTKDIQKAAANAAEAFRPMAGPSTPPAKEVVMVNDEGNEEAKEDSKEESVFYMDDDVLFGMPELVTDMYHGLGMLPPPSNTSCTGINTSGYEDVMEYDTADVSLWSYSI